MDRWSATCRQIGEILRVNVQLVSGETGAHLWSDRFDEEIMPTGASGSSRSSRG